MCVCMRVCVVVMRRYGKWGYEFGRAPYNISREEYLTALNGVCNAVLADVVRDLQGVDPVRLIFSMSSPHCTHSL